MTVLTRAFVKRFGGAALLCGGVLACLFAAAPAAASARGCTAPKTAWNFVSAPKLHPAHTHVCTHKRGTAQGLVFIDPFKDTSGLYRGPFVGQTGALMVDGTGHPVWFHRAPKGGQDLDFQTDTYYTSQSAHEPVISLWQGVIATPPKYTQLPPGAPVKGKYYIYNNQYHVIRTLDAQSFNKGWVTDFHELVLTKPDALHPQGTAIFLASKKIAANLRKYGGPPNGAYEDQEILQVNLATNKLASPPWNVEKHVPLRSSKMQAPKSGVWDAYHANSISVATAGDSLAPAGDILLSLRNTFGVYDIKPSGAIRWKLVNGNGSKYRLAKSARFYWQHDVEFHGGNQISMFDDGCCNLAGGFPKHAARGLVLNLRKGKATAVRQIHHPNTRVVPTSGNFQPLRSHTFIGWGESYFYSEYSKTNSLLYDAAMPKTDMSYRAFKGRWTGMPTTKPSAAVRHPKGKKSAIYASWNGATDVATWKVFAGKTPKTVTTQVGSAKRTGFETAIRTSNKGPYYQVKAYDSHGNPLGASAVVKR